VRKLCAQIFSHELDGWFRVPSGWPKDLTFRVFNRWFECRYHSMVLWTRLTRSFLLRRPAGNLFAAFFAVVKIAAALKPPSSQKFNKFQCAARICLKQNTLKKGDFGGMPESALGTGALPSSTSVDSTA
jgi:hypothetical protein